MPGPVFRGSAALAYKLDTLRILTRAGMIRPERPDRLFGVVRSLARWGTTFAGGTSSAAVRWPDEVAVIDEAGALTWREVHEHSNAIARALAQADLSPGGRVAIMCRNHRWMVESMIASAKLGLTAIYLNTMFAGPEVTAVCGREGVEAIICDEEFESTVAESSIARRFIAWPADSDSPRHTPTEPPAPRLADLVAVTDRRDLRPPPEPGRIVILTSGTTGGPRGAFRHQPSSLDPIASLFDRIPFRAREATLVAAPLFHSWGMVNFGFGLSLGSKYVLHRRFDPERALAAIEEHRCRALVVVPVMLQRIMQLPSEVLKRYDVSSLRIIAASGSALPGDLALAVLDHFGDVLYNFYGSTEVSWVTIAGPDDLRAAPGTAGRPPRGTVVRVLNGVGEELPPGHSGEIFVSNEMMFAGYTNGETRAFRGSLMSTGDLGHLDAKGRLFVAGRADEMIITGGENLFPREVEDLLATHEDVVEVAVIGAPDPEWSQRLRAFVVLRDGAEPDEAGLQRFVKDRLASFKVPREIIFLDELPRNAAGKILKRELPR